MYRRPLWLFTLFALVVLLQSTAFAALNIEITKGYDVATPIAIVPFNTPNVASPLELSDVIANDLHMSGRFSPLAASNFTQEPHDFKSLNINYWRGLGSDYVVVGKIFSNSGGHYDVSFELVDIFKKNLPTTSYSKGEIHTLATPNPVIMSKRFSNVDAGQMRRLAHHISDLIFEQLTGIRGAFSTRIAYIAVNRHVKPVQYSLVIADADGYSPKTVVTSHFPLMSPSWAPDAKKIAYVSFENNRAGIYTVDLISGYRDRITHFPGINGAPSWSPDGRQLALVLSKDGAAKIYTVDLYAKVLKKLTDGSSIDTEPRWFPDGKRLIFTSNRGGKPQVYQVNVLTSQVSRLTFKGDFNARASVTPDGERIVMIHRSANGMYNVAVQSLKNDDLTVLTRARLDESPSISPNGVMVLYGTQDGVEGVLGAVSTDGRVQLRLPSTEGSVQEPAWSPFLS